MPFYNKKTQRIIFPRAIWVCCGSGSGAFLTLDRGSEMEKFGSGINILGSATLVDGRWRSRR
jgi:hypothetical protein